MAKQIYSGKFKPDQYDKMAYQIHRLDGYVWEKYSEFKMEPFKPKDIMQVPMYDKYLRYVIYFLDRSGPIAEKIGNIKDRKQEAIFCAGLSEEQNVQQIMDNEFDPVNKMICGFLRIVNDLEWTWLVSAYESFYTHTDKMRSPVDTKDIGSDKEKNAFAALTQSANDSYALMEKIEAVRLRMAPEGSISKLIEKDVAKEVSSNLYESMILADKER